MVSGSKEAEFRQVVRAHHTDGICSLCDHGGATTVEHILTKQQRPDLRHVLTNCLLSHGSPRNPCPDCGQYCGQVRGNLPFDEGRRMVQAKIPAHLRARPVETVRLGPCLIPGDPVDAECGFICRFDGIPHPAGRCWVVS